MTENTSNNKSIQKSLSPEKIESSIKAFSRLFYMGGGLLIIYSVLRLTALLSNGHSPIKIYMVIINLANGICNIIFGYLLRKRKALLVYLFTGLLIINISIVILSGRYINIFPLIISFGFLCYFSMLKHLGELR